MQYDRVLKVTVISISLGMPIQALAQEVIGEVKVAMDDENRIWQTLRSTDSSIDFNTGVTEYGPVRNVNIQGYREGGSYTQDVFVISLSLMPDGTMIDQTVMHVPERMSQSWINPDCENLVTIEHLDDETILGSLSGRLCFQDGIATPVDTNNCVPVEGVFETRLPHDQ